MTTTDHTPTVDTDQQTSTPTIREQLKAVLPPWTNWTGGPLVLPGFTATWTTPTGTWTVKDEPFGWPKLIGPGGTWNFGRRDAGHIIGVLRALDALDSETDAAA